MGKSEKLSLEDELASLRQKYVKCGDCPPERNCCTFTSRYTLLLDGRQLSALSDEKSIEQLLEGENLFEIGTDRYELLNTRCPALDCDSRCILYEKREELGLDSCTDFPLYSIGKELPIVIADYRCHSMEEHWDELSPALRDISERYRVTVYVRYFTEEDWRGDLPLDDFDRFREAECIPPQRMD